MRLPFSSDQDENGQKRQGRQNDPDVEAVCIALDSAAQLLRASAGTLAVNACAVIESAMLAPVTLNARRWISVVITLSVSVFHHVIVVPGRPSAPGIMGTRLTVSTR